MKIGEVAAATATPIETIRYYEREGLLPAPQRTDGNYRIYAAHHVQRLAFIRRCRALDMTLDEVRALLGFADARGGDCSGADAVLDRHIGHVAERIAELRRLEAELRQLRARCQGPGDAASCGVLKGLAEDGPPPAPRAREHGHGHVDDLHRHQRARGK